MEEINPEKPLHVKKQTFVNFLKKQGVAVSDKDLELFMTINGMFTTQRDISKSDLISIFDEYFRAERYQFLQESHFQGNSSMKTPNQSFIPPDNSGPKNVFDSGYTGDTSQTKPADAPFRGYQDSRTAADPYNNVPKQTVGGFDQGRRNTRGQDFLNQTINDRDVGAT